MLENKAVATNKSIDHALEILEFLAGFHQSISATELSRRLQMNKATTYNILRTLQAHAYVMKTESGKYRLTSKLFEVGSLFSNGNPLPHVLSRCGSQLLSKYHCNLSLSTYGRPGMGVVVSVLQKPEDENVLGNRMLPGSGVPLHATGMGKILLAYYRTENMLEYLKSLKFKRFTEDTIVDADLLLDSLHTIRREGFAFDCGEYMPALYCIAVPVFGAGGDIRAAASMSGHFDYVTQHRDAIVHDMIQLGQRMSSELGYLQPVYEIND